MKLLEKGMQLYKNTINENISAPFFPNKWTTALAMYIRSAFPNLVKVIQKYNSARVFYKDNPAVDDFLGGLKFENSDCEFLLKDNVVYSDVITNKKPIGWQKEVFFAMKVGFVIPSVPSQHIHILQKFVVSGNLYSNLPLLYPDAQYAELTSGYIKNPIELISDILDVEFLPLSMDRLYVPSYTCGKDAMEVYLPTEDKVAVFPAELIDRLTTQDIFSIRLKNNMLHLNDKPLHELCGKFGVYEKGSMNLFNAY